MSAFLFAFIGVFLTSIGSKDQIQIAQLSGKLGRSFSLLLVGCAIAIGTAMTMAAVGAHIATLLPSAAKTMLVAFALLIAAAELVWPNRLAAPKEPTRSLGAIAIVLLARQIGDASRFLIFAFAAGAGISWFAGVGGALGGVAAVTAGWWLADDLARFLPLRAIRILLALIIGVAAVIIGLTARGLL